MKNYIKTHFLFIMLTLALLLAACGGKTTAVNTEVTTVEAQPNPSGATVEIAEKPTDDEMRLGGIYGKVTAIDGTSITISAGNYDDRHGAKQNDDIPSEMTSPHDTDAPSDDTTLQESTAVPTGVDIKAVDSDEGENHRGNFATTETTYTFTVTDNTAITIQCGADITDASTADIAVDDIVVIDGLTDGTTTPTAVTIIRAPDAK